MDAGLLEREPERRAVRWERRHCRHCALRAVRGGSWDDAPVGLRAAYRVGSPPTVRVYRRGFRVARDIE